MFRKKMCASIVVILLIFISTVSFADNLSINQWMVQASLVDNGDLNIVKDISYSFNDQFNGVYINISLKDTDGIEDLKVYELADNLEVPYKLVENAENGDKEVFTLDTNRDILELKIFSPSKNENKSFRIKYTVKNVAVNHVDTGELYYKFIADENESFIDHFYATVKLPGSNREKTKIFAHGPLNGDINFVEDSLIEVEASNVSSHQLIEARILFPKDFIGNSSKKGSNNLQNIIDEEYSFIEEVKIHAEKKARNKGIFNNLSLAVTSLIVAIGAFFLNKLRRDVDIYDKLKNLSPKDITPAELRFFHFNLADGRALMTTIFDLSRKGYIDIEEIESQKKNKQDFRLIKINKENTNLIAHEKYLLDWIFNIIGLGDSATTKDINNYRKNNMLKFNKEINLWQKKVRENLKVRGYYDERGKKYGSILLIVAIFSLTIGIISIAFNGFYGIALIIVSTLILIYAISLFYRTSDEGYIQYGMWKDFKKDMNRQKKGLSNEYDIKIPKDKTLLYALALGLPMKSLDAIKDQTSTAYTSNSWMYWYFLTNSRGGSSFEDSMNSSFYGSIGTSTSSSIGGGGGFSGGGGGGAGGSGSGGF